MTVKSRLQELEKKTSGNGLPWIMVIVGEDEDEETAIKEKLESEGMTEDQCNLIVHQIVSP